MRAQSATSWPADSRANRRHVSRPPPCPHSRRDERMRRAKVRGVGAIEIVIELLGGSLESPRSRPAARAAGQCRCTPDIGCAAARPCGRMRRPREPARAPDQVVERGLVHIPVDGILARVPKIARGVDLVAAPLVVLGDHAEVFFRAIAAAHDQPVCRQAMLLAPRLLEHALIGDLVQHVVLERELARPSKALVSRR